MEQKKASDSDGHEAVIKDPERQKQLDGIKDEMGKSALNSLVEAEAGGSVENEQISQTQRDLKMIAETTGRAEDDPEVIKLNLVLKYQEYHKFADAWTHSKANRIHMQGGFQQDIATAKRELEEAMYLYDPKFAQMDEQDFRNQAKADLRAGELKAKMAATKDLGERSKLRQELFDLQEKRRQAKQVGQQGGTVTEGISNDRTQMQNVRRRTEADKLTARLQDIADSVENSEIYATYKLYPPASNDIRKRRKAGDVYTGEIELNPHKPEIVKEVKAYGSESSSDSPEVPGWVKKNIEEDDGNYGDALETPSMKRQQFEDTQYKDERVEAGGNGLEDDPQGSEEPPIETPPETPPAIPPEEDPAERERRRTEAERQYKEAQEKFAEALAKRRSVIGGGPGHAEALAKAKDDYAKISAELLTFQYDDKLRELEGRGDLSNEDKYNELKANAIKNKLDQELELNDKIKNQIENGSLFRKVFSLVDRLPKALRPLVRMAGSNGFGILGWAGATAAGLANPVVGAAIAVGTVAAFTRPGYGGSAFEAHKDVLSAASDERSSVVVDNALARQNGESRDDYLRRLDEAAQKFGKRSRERRAIQGLGHKEGMSEELDSIRDAYDQDEVTRVFAGISDYLGKEQIELSNYDKNKNRITTGLLSVAATALSIANIPFSKIPGLQDGGWGKMAVGRFGGAANYNRINQELSSAEPPYSRPVEAETPSASPSEPGTPPAAAAGGQPATPETGGREASREYNDDQYNRAVADARALQNARGSEARVSSVIIQRNLGVGVRAANDILARMRADGVIDGEGRVR